MSVNIKNYSDWMNYIYDCESTEDVFEIKDSIYVYTSDFIEFCSKAREITLKKTIEGNNYSLIIYVPEDNKTDFYGIFSAISSTAVIKNLVIDIRGQTTINGDLRGDTGLLAPVCEGTLSNIAVLFPKGINIIRPDISSSIGGICGRIKNGGSISYSMAMGDIYLINKERSSEPNFYIGGLVGSAEAKTNIINSAGLCNIYADDNLGYKVYIGGISGDCAGEIKNSYTSYSSVCNFGMKTNCLALSDDPLRDDNCLSYTEFLDSNNKKRLGGDFIWYNSSQSGSSSYHLPIVANISEAALRFFVIPFCECNKILYENKSLSVILYFYNCTNEDKEHIIKEDDHYIWKTTEIVFDSPNIFCVNYSISDIPFVRKISYNIPQITENDGKISLVGAQFAGARIENGEVTSVNNSDINKKISGKSFFTLTPYDNQRYKNPGASFTKFIL
jgi:hypothetical protein